MLDNQDSFTLTQVLESLRHQISKLIIQRTEINLAITEASRSREMIKQLLNQHKNTEEPCPKQNQ